LQTGPQDAQVSNFQRLEKQTACGTAEGNFCHSTHRYLPKSQKENSRELKFQVLEFLNHQEPVKAAVTSQPTAAVSLLTM
jgi:hypothetical protein